MKLPRMDWVWTQEEGGGEFIVTSSTTGTGSLHREILVHYRRLATGGMGPVYTMRLEEWPDKMKPLKT